MAFNGSGTFNRLYTWVNDAAANIKIRADRMDNEMNGFATGLSTCITKDGQTTITANLPMAGFKHTGVGDATDRAHYSSFGQLQDGKASWVAAGGSADAITATYTIPITALVDGQYCFVRAGAANATTTPTFSPNALTARTIVKNGGQALVAGDIYGAGHELILRYNLANTRWELLNPAVVATAAVTDATISTSDITTNNASSTKHGWSPKSPADATKFLNGASTPAYALVKDSDLSISDITTNNASASNHGFLKKLSGTSTEYMDGSGNWSTPTSTIDYYTANTTSGSTAVITLTKTYKILEFIINGTSSSTSVVLTVDISDDGGATYGTAVTLNIASASNYSGFGKITHTGVAATNKRIFSSCSITSASFASGSNGFNVTATESSKTGITNRVRFNTSGTFDNGEVIVIGYS